MGDANCFHRVTTLSSDASTRLSLDLTNENADWGITFPYAGCEVTVSSTETVVVTKQTPPREPDE